LFLDLVLGDTDDKTTYRDTKSITIILSILHAANHLCTPFRNIVTSNRHFDYRPTAAVVTVSYRAMHFSAERGLAIACRPPVRLFVCLSVCDVGGL